MTSRLNVVAIDGPAGSGKSTVARLVAERLRFIHIDTGAMYRALTLRTVNAGIAADDADAVSQCADEAVIALAPGRIMLDGRDVSAEIRTPEVTRLVPKIAQVPEVRAVLLKIQRACAISGDGVVMEGRDIGTVVFPDARWKFFLDASIDERARRRHEELKAAGEDREFAWVRADLIERDRQDRERPVAPLRKADDARVIDTSALTIDEVADTIVAAVNSSPA